MCLALFYQLGLRFSLYEPMALEDYVSNPVLLLIGSFILGFGFIFADGCFIGSLWKTGQGNVINAVGIIGLLIGIGITEFGKTILVQHTNPTASPIPNYISSAISPFIYLVVLWIAGISLLIVFKQKRYRY